MAMPARANPIAAAPLSFLGCANLQHEVQARLLGDCQRDTGLHTRPEHLQAGAHLVPTWRQPGHGEVPVRVGGDVPRQACTEIGDHDIDANLMTASLSSHEREAHDSEVEREINDPMG
jgi:hypothetical protein